MDSKAKSNWVRLLICLQFFAYLVKAGAGLCSRKALFKEGRVISGPAERVSTMDTPGRGALPCSFSPAAQAAL